MSLPHTRELLHAALSGRIDEAAMESEPFFGLRIPRTVPDAPTEILNPKNTWADKAAYDEQAKKLAGIFVENFKKFGDVESRIREAGPKQAETPPPGAIAKGETAG